MNPFVIAFRRIIYSIPLKLLLILLAVFGVLFACFSNAQFTGDCIKTDIKTKVNLIGNYTKTNPSWYIGDMFKAWLLLQPNQTVHNDDITYHGNYICFGSAGNDTLNYCNHLEIIYNNTTYLIDTRSEFPCFYFEGDFDFHNPENTACEWIGIVPNRYSDIIISQYTSLQCQTEYNLIPISSVDQNYCTTNNLCPSEECPEIPVWTGEYSQLYINNILHLGAPTIIMNIPEEIDWDYAYTAGGQNMNIDIVGYNQDFEKIEGRIETNNYKPSSEDFTNIFTGGFSNFGGLLVATLFVILVFYFVKKMFK